MLIPATCVAEIRIIAVCVTSDSKSRTRVSIYSDVAKENKRNVSVKEAVAVMRKAEGWGSSVKVGIVADNVLLGEYLPLLNTISQNLMLELAFIDAEKPNFMHRNIRQRIEDAEAGERQADTPD